MNRLITILPLALVACADLDPPTLIKRDRVLGAKVSVDGDPARAWPAPGERATVSWLTASPGDPPQFSWILAACPAATSSGMPACAGPLLASSQGAGLVPALQLDVPVDLTAPALVVMGVICATGAPVVDGAGFAATCDDGSRADLVSQHVFISRDQEVNHNPELAGAPFTVADAGWAPATDAGCDDDLPVVKAGSGRTLLGVTFDATDRETYHVAGEPAPAREELQLSAFTTAGELVQQRSYVDADDDRAATPVAFEWEPPRADEVPAGGLRVKFHFVVRDLRGGVDAASRVLCVR